MEYRSIADIYESNDRVHAKLCGTLEALTEEQIGALPGGEKWSVAQVVEHVSLVEGGIYRICAKLLSKAENGGQLNDGKLDLAEFMQKAAGIIDVKLDAPEYVRPTGGRPISESLQVLEDNAKAFSELRPSFEKYDGNAHKFPHPYLGELSAVEWLALTGGHKIRHLMQIKRTVESLGWNGE